MTCVSPTATFVSGGATPSDPMPSLLLNSVAANGAGYDAWTTGSVHVVPPPPGRPPPLPPKASGRGRLRGVNGEELFAPPGCNALRDGITRISTLGGGSAAATAAVHTAPTATTRVIVEHFIAHASPDRA